MRAARALFGPCPGEDGKSPGTHESVRRSRLFVGLDRYSANFASVKRESGESWNCRSARGLPDQVLEDRVSEMRRFNFTTLAMVLMAVLVHPHTDTNRYAADFSAPAVAAMMSGVADGPASVES